MDGVGESGGARRRDRHRRALAVSADEQQALAGRARERIEKAAFRQRVGEFAIGRVNRSLGDAAPSTLGQLLSVGVA